MLSSYRLPLKVTSVITLLFLGLVGLVLIFLTTEIYHELVLDNANKNLAALIELESQTAREKHNELTHNLATYTIEEKGFKEAIEKKDIDALRKIINNQFSQYFVTANIVDLDHIMVLDKDYNLLTSSNHNKMNRNHNAHCNDFLNNARQRKGAANLQDVTAICAHHNHALHLALFPIGTFKNPGYLLIATRIEKAYTKIDLALGLPIKIQQTDNTTFYLSESWPKSNKKGEFLIAEFVLPDHLNRPALRISAAQDFSDLSNSLGELRFYALLFSSLITLIAITLALFFLTRSALLPLSALNNHLRAAQKDRSRLGQTIELDANPEIMELADNYNGLSKALKKAYTTLERMAYTDPLTTLPNRSQLQRQLDYHTSQTEERDVPFALFLMDLDRFKQVNDTLGHQAGDSLLQDVSRRLQKVLRKTDIVTRIDDWEIIGAEQSDVARLGGDEFAAVLPSVGTVTDAVQVAQKILNEMSAPFTLDSHEFNVGISIGIVLAPVHGIEPSVLMRKADVAMYHAKNNQLGYFIYDEQSDKHSIEILSLDSDIVHAAENDEFELYFQPKIELASNRVVGAEALIRWQKPDGKMIFPDEFIPHSEQTGTIHRITEWVIISAIKTLREWEKNNFDLSIAINLSSKSFHNREISKTVLHKITQAQVNPEKIYLEITESSLMMDPKRAANILRQINCEGIKVSIDDFGTGYSSLSKLKTLPVDEIKIDRSFVMDMLNDHNDAIIAQSIIDLAHNMNMTVTAEGVENQEILNKLHDMKCELAQGYHIAKPMPASEFYEWLKTSQWGLKN